MAGSVVGAPVLGSGSVVGVGMTVASACASCTDDATSVPVPLPVFLVLGRRRLLVDPFAVPSYVGTVAGTVVGTVDGFAVGVVGWPISTLGVAAWVLWETAVGVQVVLVAGAGGGAGVGVLVGCMDGPFTGATLGAALVGAAAACCTSSVGASASPCSRGERLVQSWKISANCLSATA